MTHARSVYQSGTKCCCAWNSSQFTFSWQAFAIWLNTDFNNFWLVFVDSRWGIVLSPASHNAVSQNWFTFILPKANRLYPFVEMNAAIFKLQKRYVSVILWGSWIPLVMKEDIDRWKRESPRFKSVAQIVSAKEPQNVARQKSSLRILLIYTVRSWIIIWIIFLYGWWTARFNLLPDITNDDETIVPAQKNIGGCSSTYVKATIHGKLPLEKFWPRLISPELIFEIPQVPRLLRDRLACLGSISVETLSAIMLITTRSVLISGLILKVDKSAQN